MGRKKMWRTARQQVAYLNYLDKAYAGKSLASMFKVQKLGKFSIAKYILWNSIILVFGLK